MKDYKIKIKSSECFCGSPHRRDFWGEFYNKYKLRDNERCVIIDDKQYIEFERYESGPVFLFALCELANNPYFINIVSSFIYDFIKLLIETDNRKHNNIDYEISFRKENHKTKEYIDSTIKFKGKNIPDSNSILKQINDSIKDLL